MTANTLSKTKSFADLIEQAEKALAESFQDIDGIALNNQKRVLRAFKDNRLSEDHFAECTGYGLQDPARTVIDNIYAQVMQAPAVVRYPPVHVLLCLVPEAKPSQTCSRPVPGRDHDRRATGSGC